jgi:hypothetical protein
MRKYELKMITIKEHPFTIRTTHYFTAENNCLILQDIWYQVKIYDFILLNIIYHLILHVLELRTESLQRFLHAEA